MPFFMDLHLAVPQLHQYIVLFILFCMSKYNFIKILFAHTVQVFHFQLIETILS